MFIKGEEGKKGKKKIVIIAVLIAAAAGTAAGMAVYHKNKGHQEENTQEAYETTVSLGMISNTITGTGNLELDDAEAVAVPSGITIKEVFAESGDYVSAGTVLAEVEESSVLTAVEDLQEELDELDQKISQCQEQEDENTVASSVSGRVKAIYVETGSDVTEVMLEQGSLMILSLDGLLAADIEGEAPGEVNEQTEVLLQDGTAVTGTIEAVNDAGYVITVSDETASAGDTVTVSETAGQGELYIHRPLEITGTVGNVEEIYVSLNEEVASGDALLSLSGSESDGEYEELLALRKARTETLTELLELEENPQITAPFDGTVQDVNVAASSTAPSAADSNSQTGNSGGGTTAALQTFSAGTAGFLLLSFDDGTSGAENFSSSSETGGVRSSENSQTETPEKQQLMFSIAGAGESGSSLLVLPAPQAGGIPVLQVSASDGTYSGIVTWNPGDESFAEGVSYQALVVLQAAEGYFFGADSIQGNETGTVSGIQVSEDGGTLEFQIAFPVVPENVEVTITAEEETTETEEAETNQNLNENVSAGDDETKTEKTDETASGQQTAGGESTDTRIADSGSSGGQNSASQASGSGSAATASQQNGSAASETDEQNAGDTEDIVSQYSTDVTAFTISPNEDMILNISVDELDINSVELGQTAEITFDAIEDKTFQGEVTKIGNTASVNGGVAKYSVEITVPRDEEMREGMNASAVITIEERSQILTLPMNALQEQGDRTYVYTEKEEDGTLSGETDISTGLSDGNTVEITEGLEEGNKVYYMRSGSSSASENGSGASGDERPEAGGSGEGGMPGGASGGNGDFGNGDMPEMGGQRGGGPGMQE